MSNGDGNLLRGIGEALIGALAGAVDAEGRGRTDFLRTWLAQLNEARARGREDEAIRTSAKALLRANPDLAVTEDEVASSIRTNILPFLLPPAEAQVRRGEEAEIDDAYNRAYAGLALGPNASPAALRAAIQGATDRENARSNARAAATDFLASVGMRLQGTLDHGQIGLIAENFKQALPVNVQQWPDIHAEFSQRIDDLAAERLRAMSFEEIFGFVSRGGQPQDDPRLAAAFSSLNIDQREKIRQKQEEVRGEVEARVAALMEATRQGEERQFLNAVRPDAQRLNLIVDQVRAGRGIRPEDRAYLMSIDPKQLADSVRSERERATHMALMDAAFSGIQGLLPDELRAAPRTPEEFQRSAAAIFSDPRLPLWVNSRDAALRFMAMARATDNPVFRDQVRSAVLATYRSLPEPDRVDFDASAALSMAPEPNDLVRRMLIRDEPPGMEQRRAVGARGVPLRSAPEPPKKNYSAALREFSALYGAIASATDEYYDAEIEELRQFVSETAENAAFLEAIEDPKAAAERERANSVAQELAQIEKLRSQPQTMVDVRRLVAATVDAAFVDHDDLASNLAPVFTELGLLDQASAVTQLEQEVAFLEDTWEEALTIPERIAAVQRIIRGRLGSVAGSALPSRVTILDAPAYDRAMNAVQQYADQMSASMPDNKKGWSFHVEDAPKVRAFDHDDFALAAAYRVLADSGRGFLPGGTIR